MPLGRLACQLRQQLLDVVHDLDRVRAGLALHVEDDRRNCVHPGRELGVFRSPDDLRDIAQPHRCSIAIGDDQVAVGIGILQFVVGVDRIGAQRAIESALRRVDIGIADGGAQIVDVEAMGGKRAQIGLDPDGGALAASDMDDADAGQLRDLLRQPRIGDILDLGQGQGPRRHRQGEDRRVRRVDLEIDRRRRQVRRQQVAGAVDRRLDFLLGDVEVEIEVELQIDDGGAGRADR